MLYSGYFQHVLVDQEDDSAVTYSEPVELFSSEFPHLHPEGLVDDIPADRFIQPEAEKALDNGTHHQVGS